MKLRVSYSLLRLWESGRVDEAVKFYFHLLVKKKVYEEVGIDFHEKWQKYIEKHKELPIELGGGKLKDPKCELKLKVDGSVISKEYDWLELVGMIDCLDGDTVHEFKSGVTRVGSYEKSQQMPLYAFLARGNGYPVDKLIIHHYNQEEDETEVSMIWYTKKREEKLLDYVTTLSYEIYEYFNNQKLWGLNEQGNRQEVGRRVESTDTPEGTL